MFISFDNVHGDNLKLPDGVAYKAGVQFEYKYLIMSTHYPGHGGHGPVNRKRDP